MSDKKEDKSRPDSYRSPIPVRPVKRKLPISPNSATFHMIEQKPKINPDVDYEKERKTMKNLSPKYSDAATDYADLQNSMPMIPETHLPSPFCGSELSEVSVKLSDLKAPLTKHKTKLGYSAPQGSHAKETAHYSSATPSRVSADSESTAKSESG